MNSNEFLDTLNKINEYTMNCIELNIMIKDGKDFLDAINQDGKTIWFKYEKEPINDK